MPEAGTYYPPETDETTAERATAEEKLREAARILVENKKRMLGEKCGIVEDGDSDRKKAAIQKLLQNNERHI